MKYTHKQVKDILTIKKGPGRGLIEDTEIITDLDLIDPYEIIEQLLEECESWKSRASTESLRAKELENALEESKAREMLNFSGFAKIIKDLFRRIFG